MGVRLLALALASAALYAANLADPFLGDDFDLIRSFHGKPLAYFPALLWSNESGDVWKAFGIDPALGHGYLRPAKIWLLALDRALFGLDPRGFHATATVGFVASVCLAAALGARALPGRPWLAIAGALVAAMHPVFSEIVPFITAREETFAIAFGLAALLALMRHREDGRSSFAFAGWLAAALATKESGLAFLLLAVVWDLVHSRELAWRELARPWVPAGCVVAVYFALRWIAFGNLVGGEGDSTHFFSHESLRYYPKLVRSLGDSTLVSVGALPTAALALAPVVGVAVFWRRIPKRRRRDLLFFGPGWLVGSTALYVGLHFATRHHALPVIGLALFAAVALGALLEAGVLRGERRISVALVAVAAMLFLPSSLTTSREFREASRVVERARVEIEARAAEIPDGSQVLVRNVPQLVLPPYYFGWALVSSLRSPFSPSDLAGRIEIVNRENRYLNRVRATVPEVFDHTLDLDAAGRIPPWIRARHRLRAQRDFR